MQEPSGHAGRGIAFIVLSATGFALLPIFAKNAYAEGLEPFSLLAWRFVIAAALLWVIAAVRSRRVGQPVWIGRPLALKLFVLGAVSLSVEVILYFEGVKYLTAGLTETLLYLYPAWVVVISVVAFGLRPPGLVWVCVAGAVVGAALTVGGLSGGSPLGVALMIGASFTFGIFVTLSGRIGAGVNGFTSSAWIMSGAAVTFTILTLITGAAPPSTADAWMAVVAAALPGGVIAFGFLAMALNYLSAPVVAVVATIEPILAVIAGAVVLDEAVTVIQVVGMLIIVGSVALMLWIEARAGQAEPLPVEPA